MKLDFGARFYFNTVPAVQCDEGGGGGGGLCRVISFLPARMQSGLFTGFDLIYVPTVLSIFLGLGRPKVYSLAFKGKNFKKNTKMQT